MSKSITFFPKPRKEAGQSNWPIFLIRVPVRWYVFNRCAHLFDSLHFAHQARTGTICKYAHMHACAFLLSDGLCYLLWCASERARDRSGRHLCTRAATHTGVAHQQLSAYVWIMYKYLHITHTHKNTHCQAEPMFK